MDRWKMSFKLQPYLSENYGLEPFCISQCAIRIRLQLANDLRELAMFNLVRQQTPYLRPGSLEADGYLSRLSNIAPHNHHAKENGTVSSI